LLLAYAVHLAVFAPSIDTTIGTSSIITMVITTGTTIAITTYRPKRPGPAYRELRLPDLADAGRAHSLRCFPDCRRGVVFGPEYAEALLMLVVGFKAFALACLHMPDIATLVVDTHECPS
jgi:hypothetical protein